MRCRLALLCLFLLVGVSTARGSTIYTYALDLSGGSAQCEEEDSCADGVFAAADGGSVDVLLSFEADEVSRAGDTVKFALTVLKFSVVIPGTGYTFIGEDLTGWLELQDNRPYNWESSPPQPHDWYEDRALLTVDSFLFVLNDAYGTVAHPPDMVGGTGTLAQRFQGFDETDGGTTITLPDGSLQSDHTMHLVSVEVPEPALLPLGLPALGLLLRARRRRLRRVPGRARSSLGRPPAIRGSARRPPDPPSFVPTAPVTGKEPLTPSEPSRDIGRP